MRSFQIVVENNHLSSKWPLRSKIIPVSESKLLVGGAAIAMSLCSLRKNSARGGHRMPTGESNAI